MANDLSLVIKAVDNASRQITVVQGHLQAMGISADRASVSVGRLDRAFGGLRGQVGSGFGLGAGAAMFNGLIHGAERLISTLPDLIGKGRDWARLVDEITDVTGMSVEQASELAGVMRFMGVPTDRLAQTFVFLSRSIRDNEAEWTRLGIATRDENGRLHDAYTIFRNLQGAISEHGASMQSSTVVAELLGRAGFRLNDVLQMNAEEFREVAQWARDAGLVMSTEALAAAEQLDRSYNQLGGSITGLGNSIMLAVAPVLSDFISAISGWITANLENIQRFAVQVVGFIAGLLSGLFGIDLNFNNLAERVTAAGGGRGGGGRGGGAGGGSWGRDDDTPAKRRAAARGEDAYTASLQRQIEALDDQIDALNRRERAHDAARERQQILRDLSEARTELDRLQTNRVYTEGMTHLEQVLAQQARAADILEARRRISDTTDQLREHDRDQEKEHQRQILQAQRERLQDQLEAHRKALSAMERDNAASAARVITPWRGPRSPGPTIARGLAGAFDKFKTESAGALEQGRSVAEGLKGAFRGLLETLFGPEQATLVGGSVIRHRQGGLVGALGTVGELFRWVAEHAKEVAASFAIWKTLGLFRNILDLFRGGGGGGVPLPGRRGGGTTPRSGAPGPGPLGWLASLIPNIPAAVFGVLSAQHIVAGQTAIDEHRRGERVLPFPTTDESWGGKITQLITEGVGGALGGLGGGLATSGLDTFRGLSLLPELARNFGVLGAAGAGGPGRAPDMAFWTRQIEEVEATRRNLEQGSPLINSITGVLNQLGFGGPVVEQLETGVGINPATELGVRNALFANLPLLGDVSANTRPLSQGSVTVSNANFPSLAAHLPGIGSIVTQTRPLTTGLNVAVSNAVGLVSDTIVGIAGSVAVGNPNFPSLAANLPLLGDVVAQTKPLADGTLTVQNPNFPTLTTHLPLLGSVVANTKPLFDGTLTVQNPNFPRLSQHLPLIGAITRIGSTVLTGGALPVSNSNLATIPSISSAVGSVGTNVGALLVRTKPGGQLFDNVGTAISEAGEAASYALGARTNAGTASTKAGTAATNTSGLPTKMTNVLGLLRWNGWGVNYTAHEAWRWAKAAANKLGVYSAAGAAAASIAGASATAVYVAPPTTVVNVTLDGRQIAQNVEQRLYTGSAPSGGLYPMSGLTAGAST